jgi:glycosyltransferase involved in cell wall biosynthesis
MKLAIEGWRSVPHSYALINQFLCLELMKRSNVSMSHQDLPFFDPSWDIVKGLFSPEQEVLFDQYESLPADQDFDARWRVAFPFDLQSSWEPTFVFATSECYIIPDCFIAGNQPLFRAIKDSQSTIVTCSNWSLEGFLRSGMPLERTALVPLGFDPDLYKPLEDEARKKLRSEKELEDCFVFLNIGAISENKGIDILLKAFACIASRYPEVRLFLKGLDPVYNSKNSLDHVLNKLTEAEKNQVLPKLIYSGSVLSFADCARLYQFADAYVSPYRAEAFNLPVLEAAACGLPVICTQGGSTDDFIHPNFALTIDSKMTFKVERMIGAHWILEPNCEHLIAQMTEVIENHHLRVQAKQMGPAFVGERFTWSKVTDRLLECFGGQPLESICQ